MAARIGAPPERRIDAEDSDEDKIVKSFHSIFSQHCKAQGLAQAKYPKTAPQRDADKRKKDWKKARGSFCAAAAAKMFEQDSRTHPLFTIEPNKIDYADVTIASDIFTERLLKAINTSKQDLFYLGFDTEGDLDVLQIHAKFEEYERSIIFQLNMLHDNGHLPAGLVELLLHPCVVFVGKLVEIEAVSLFEKFNVSSKDFAGFKYVKILDLVRVCDVFSRPTFDDALNFVSGRGFKIYKDVQKGVKHDALINAGVRAGMAYFTNFVIDKRVHHVHPHHVDWSLKSKAALNRLQMTDSMRGYCCADAKAPIIMHNMAASLTEFNLSDFVRLARPSPKTDPPVQFLNGKMELFFAAGKKNGLCQNDIVIQDRVRAHHQRRLYLESVWQQQRKAIYISQRDPWRRDRGYHEILERDDIDPFLPGGIWDQIGNPRLISLLESGTPQPPLLPTPTTAATDSFATPPTSSSAAASVATPSAAPFSATPLSVATPSAASPAAASACSSTTSAFVPASTFEEDLEVVDEWRMDTESSYSPSHPTPTTPSPLVTQQPSSESTEQRRLKFQRLQARLHKQQQRQQQRQLQQQQPPPLPPQLLPQQQDNAPKSWKLDSINIWGK